MAHPIDHALRDVLERRPAARVIRRYGVAAFLRRAKGYVAAGGHHPERLIYGRERPEISLLMAEVFARAML